MSTFQQTAVAAEILHILTLISRNPVKFRSMFVEARISNLKKPEKERKKTLENVGKTLGTSWKPWKPLENPWKPLETRGKPWKTWKPLEDLGIDRLLISG